MLKFHLDIILNKKINPNDIDYLNIIKITKKFIDNYTDFFIDWLIIKDYINKFIFPSYFTD
jgi:hypothetical protein